MAVEEEGDFPGEVFPSIADAADAAVLVRRYANQHRCARVRPEDPPCRHRNHRRDAALMAEYMSALGLDGNGPVPLAPRVPLAEHETAPPVEWQDLLAGILRRAS